MELIILSFTWDSKPTEWWPWIIKLFACWLATCLECEAQNSYWKQLTKDCQSKFYVLLMNLLPSGSFFRELNTVSVLTQSGLKTESTHGTHWMTTFTEALKTLEDKKFESLEKLFPVRLMNIELNLCFHDFLSHPAVVWLSFIEEFCLLSWAGQRTE